MEMLKKMLNEIILGEFGVDFDASIILEKEKFGDYSTNAAMILAGKLHKNPREIALAIIAKMPSEVAAEIAGAGFINFTLPAALVFREVSEKWNEKYGENNSGNGKKAIVEYPSQNMAKPYSVGHLRPGTQGAAAANILRANGWEIITDNHLGDYGTPFGIWVVGFLRLSDDARLAEGGVYELGRIYIEMKKILKDASNFSFSEKEKLPKEKIEDKNSPDATVRIFDNKSLAEEVQDWLLKLEKGDAEAVEYSRRFKEISLAHIHEVMRRLGLATDLELGEAFFAPMGKELVEKYVDLGVFVKNEDGSVVCTLDEFGIETPILLQKSNGAALYATNDLATLVYREENFAPDKVVYAVGAEQKFYFEQLFAMAHKLGIETDLVHLWFGTIDQMTDGKREKMSSRKGVVLMEELLDEAEARARAMIRSAEDASDGVSSKNVSDEDIRRIATGAIKFADFVADRKMGILFDWETIFALTGFSAAYVQYAGVRMKRILSSLEDFEMADFGAYDFEAEKSLLKLLAEYPLLVARVGENLEMHKLSHFAYDLAVAVNKYYEKTPILKASSAEKSARVLVLRWTLQVLTHCLGLIGVEIPERM
ncbi:MAG: arginine--tRNA ligase [Candidatus Nomurabacteria bacterium]|jgi:arginyl-tRNA synthetase|nr:arginine--tRNA ligase [Candidatus Nomurabacteria bacterium]